MTIERDKLIEMLRVMQSIRAFECKARELYEENRKQDWNELRATGTMFCAVHSSEGQEAVAVGACAALNPDDYIISTHRGHGHCIAKGADMKAMMAELMGKEGGISKGRGGSMHMFDPEVGLLGSNGIVGGGTPLALGVAFASQYRGTDEVTLCFFGDGAACEGTFHESLNLAALWTLPVVFVCENNEYAVTISAEDSVAGPDIGDRASAYGIPGEVVDGNDVLAVHEAVAKAVSWAREEAGPSLIECKTWRWHAHCTGLPDRRDPDEIYHWTQERDPLPRFEQYLLGQQIITDAKLAQMRKETNEAVEEAVAFGEASNWPDPTTVAEYLWA